MDISKMARIMPIAESYGLTTIAQLHTILLFFDKAPCTISEASGTNPGDTEYKRHVDKINKFNKGSTKRTGLKLIKADHYVQDGVAVYRLTDRGRRLRSEIMAVLNKA